MKTLKICLLVLLNSIVFISSGTTRESSGDLWAKEYEKFDEPLNALITTSIRQAKANLVVKGSVSSGGAIFPAAEVMSSSKLKT